MSDRKVKHFYYYWKHFARDTQVRPIYGLNGDAAGLAEIQRGDVVWLFLARDERHLSLVSSMIVTETRRPGEMKRGNTGKAWKYYFGSDPSHMVFFVETGQVDLSQTFRSAGWTINAHPGNSTQSKSGKSLMPNLVRRLEEISTNLQPDDRLTSRSAIEAWQKSALKDDTQGLSSGDPEFQREEQRRDSWFVRRLKELYRGRCQVSGDVLFGGTFGDLTEAHHIEWLCRGGADHTDNMVIISPNFHRALHAGNGYFDWQKRAFQIGEKVFPLVIDLHLPANPGQL